MSSPNNAYQLIRHDNQLPVVKQYFTNITAIQNMGYYIKFDPMKSLGYVTDMSQYHNAGI